MKAEQKSLVLWSAGYWTETVDSTYVEYRLPILSNYLLYAYPYSYKIGRFVIFSAEQSLPVESNVAGQIRDKYDLGFAPSKMGPYKQEHVSTLIANAIGTVDISESKPDAIIVDVNATGGGLVFIVIRNNGETTCTISFRVPKGSSENFVRLSNIPAYVRHESDEIIVNIGDSGTSINTINYINL